MSLWKNVDVIAAKNQQPNCQRGSSHGVQNLIASTRNLVSRFGVVLARFLEEAVDNGCAGLRP